MSDDLWLSLPHVAATPKKDKPEPRPQEPMRAQIKGPRRNPTSDQKSQRRQQKRRPAKTAAIGNERRELRDDSVIDVGYDTERRFANATLGYSEIAWMSWEANGVISFINVDEDHRRQGVATAMWEVVKAVVPNLQHSPSQTEEGAVWAGHVGSWMGKAAADDYRGGHSAPSTGAPLHDLVAGGTFPADVYEHPEYYVHGSNAYDSQSARLVKQYRGKPDARVTIYRAVPPKADHVINTGDWVAITESYAVEHGDGQGWEEWVEPKDPDNFKDTEGWVHHEGGWLVLSAEVPAASVRSGGNDIIEWGYWGSPITNPKVRTLKMYSKLASLRTEIELLRPQLSAAVQHIVDQWTQDDEGFDEEFGYGGACDQAADAMASVLGDHGIETTSGGADGDDHAWVVALRGEEVVGVDIPPGVYETGGGYSWTKRQDVSISPRDVEVWDLDVPAENFREGMTKNAAKFEPGQMANWESTRPWNLTRAEAEAQLVPGWWFKSQRGTESASWEKGYIRPSPEFFTYPEGVRRGIAYHEAGHAMVQAAGGIGSLPDPLSIVDLPGATILGYNAEEVLAEGYSTLWTEPSWFDQYTAVRDLVVGMARKANFPLPSSLRTAMRPPIPVVQWRPSKDGHGGSGVVSAERGPIVAYRGFGSWGEAKDSLRRGEWISSGMFTVRGEGDTQMALDLNDVLGQSGMHRLRGTGFLGFIEADISGLPFSTFVTIESNPVDETRGNFEPSTGLGIGIVGGIPLDRIRRVVALNEDGTWNEMSVQGLRNSIDKLEDRAGWEPEVKHRPETHRFPIIWKKRAKEYHKANYNQSGAECGAQLGYDYENALVSQGDLMEGGKVRNLWMRHDEMLKGLPKKPCPECFPWARTQMVAALSLEAVISVAEQTMERAGLAGRTLYIPTGHADDPEYKAAIAPYKEMVENLVGRRIYNFYASDYQLDTFSGGAQAETDGHNYICVRPVTNMMTILHEVAHMRLGEREMRGHTPEFVSTVEHLYREHLGDAAADQFMLIIGDRV